jgi:uncharacterized protein (TIGR02466 family)
MKPRLLNVQNTLMAFATPIRQTQYDKLQEFNADLAKRILTLRGQSVGEKHSNVGGWQSDDKLLQTLGEPYATQLARMFLENVYAIMDQMVETTAPRPAQFSVEAWANVNERGHSNVGHIHPGCPWSGVYYVTTDTGPEAGGQIVFTDPRTAALMFKHPFNPFPAGESITATPRPGMMLVFPSFIYHDVLVYCGEAPRISIGLNMK